MCGLKCILRAFQLLCSSAEAPVSCTKLNYCRRRKFSQLNEYQSLVKFGTFKISYVVKMSEANADEYFLCIW